MNKKEISQRVGNLSEERLRMVTQILDRFDRIDRIAEQGQRLLDAAKAEAAELEKEDPLMQRIAKASKKELETLFKSIAPVNTALADQLNCPRRTLHDAVIRGEIPSFFIGPDQTKYMVQIKDVKRWMANHYNQRKR